MILSRHADATIDEFRVSHDWRLWLQILLFCGFMTALIDARLAKTDRDVYRCDEIRRFARQSLKRADDTIMPAGITSQPEMRRLTLSNE